MRRLSFNIAKGMVQSKLRLLQVALRQWPAALGQWLDRAGERQEEMITKTDGRSGSGRR